jgi:hypothetical protein
MYDIGQGNNIKDVPQVFEISVPDDRIGCPYNKFDKGKIPEQIPPGKLNSYKTVEERFTDNSQHSKSGEPSDMILLCMGILMAAIAITLVLKM